MCLDFRHRKNGINVNTLKDGIGHLAVIRACLLVVEWPALPYLIGYV